MREYTIGGGNITVANQAVTLIFLNPGTTAGYRILRMWISQAANATSAQQRVEVVTQLTAFPTLTSVTPKKLKGPGDPTAILVGGTAGAAGTCGINASAEGAGAKTVLWDDSFNVLNGYLWIPSSEKETLWMPPGGSAGLGLHFPAAPATLTGWTFGMNFEELG